MSSDESSSDDGGLRHITMQRARPPSGRRLNKGRTRSLRDDSSSCDSDGELSPSFNALPPPPPRPSVASPPLFSKGDSVEYISNGQPYQAVIQTVDVTVQPPSYVVAFSDGSERTTEASRLRKPEVSPVPPLETAEPKQKKVELEPEPEINEEQTQKKEKKEKKQKKEKKEKKEGKSKQKEEEKKTVPAEKENSPVVTEEERKRKKQLMPKPMKVTAAVARVIPNTKIYGAMTVDKVSNRGFKHRRIMLLTSTFVVFAKEDGEVRRVVEVKHLDSILVQDAVGAQKVLLQLLASSGEPDVLFSCRNKTDARNTHPTPVQFLQVLSKICEATPPSSHVPINNVTSTTDIKLLIRTEVEKPDVKTKLDHMTRNAKNKQAISTADSDGECEESSAAPAWKPDSSSVNCEACKKPFTLIRRRHHCRACGGVFCGPCSSLKISLAVLGPEPVRCCENCSTRHKESLAR